MTCLVVIPARWGSSRFPGKPLAMIAGSPLLARTIDLARRAASGLADVEIVVSTDDPRVEALACAEGCEVVRTESSLTSGSARALAAARLRSPAPATIVNLQGDAPFLPPAAVGAVIAALAEGAAVATPVVRLDWAGLDALRRHKLDAPFSGTTCVVNPNGTARWFSKAIIPAMRDEDALRQTTRWSPVFRHLGLYGYTLEALHRFDAAPPAPYERLEGLEQLRFLEMGIDIHAVQLEERAGSGSFDIGGIDTPADVVLAERLIAERGDPCRG